MVSLPALFNIGALLSLITFIYAIIGMTLFGHVMHAGALNDQVNFETFARAMLLLFRYVSNMYSMLLFDMLNLNVEKNLRTSTIFLLLDL